MKTRYILQCGLIFIGTLVPTAFTCHDVEIGFIQGMSAVPVGSYAEYSLTQAASCSGNCTVFTYTWKVNGDVVDSGSNTSYGQTWSDIGTKTLSVTASCGGGGSAASSMGIRVVGIDRIQYYNPESGWMNVTGPLGVGPGSSILFKAIKTPSQASWPSGKPVWGGTSGASGIGETKTVPFNINVDECQTVTAECGNTKSVNVYGVGVALTVENDITECMEGRWVTFTATASTHFPHGLTNPIYFTFHYQRADGTDWSETDWSTDLVEDNTVIADNVPAGDPDHKFTTPIYVVANNDTAHAVSNTLNIDVYELWIEYFRDSASGKDWKVVVGLPIEYSAIASRDCKNWRWDMEDGFPDVWNPTGGNQKTGLMTIPSSDMPTDDDWDHFGDAYGTVNVFCEDGEGNNHRFYSTSMNPSQTAKVFFHPGVQTNPGGISDNWFYYWKYALFGNVSDVTWNASIQYGSTLPTGAIQIGDSGNNDYITAYDHESITGITNNFRPSADGKSRIDLFYSVLTHELQHRADMPHYGQPPDSDGDFLPDNIDPFPGAVNGANYPEYQGGNSWMGDWEFRARSVEDVVAPADRDWSMNGKQW